MFGKGWKGRSIRGLAAYLKAYSANNGKLNRLVKEHPEVGIAKLVNNSGNQNKDVTTIDEALNWDYSIKQEELDKLINYIENEEYLKERKLSILEGLERDGEGLLQTQGGSQNNRGSGRNLARGLQEGNLSGGDASGRSGRHRTPADQGGTGQAASALGQGPAGTAEVPYVNALQDAIGEIADGTKGKAGLVSAAEVLSKALSSGEQDAEMRAEAILIAVLNVKRELANRVRLTEEQKRRIYGALHGIERGLFKQGYMEHDGVVRKVSDVVREFEEHFGLTAPTTLEQFKENIDAILGEYSDREMANWKVREYLGYYTDTFGSEFLSEFGTVPLSKDSESKFDTWLKRRQGEVRKGVNQRRRDAVAAANVDNILNLAERAAAEEQKGKSEAAGSKTLNEELGIDDSIFDDINSIFDEAEGESRFSVSDTSVDVVRKAADSVRFDISDEQSVRLVDAGLKAAIKVIPKVEGDFGKFAQVMVTGIGERIKPYLTKIWGQAYMSEELDSWADKMTPRSVVRNYDLSKIGRQTARREAQGDKRQEEKANEKTSADFLNEALKEVLDNSGKSLPANITIDESTIEDNPDSAELTARLLIDGKPSDFSVTILDQSLGARGLFDPTNMVKFYPSEMSDKWDWDLADRLGEEFNKGRTKETGFASVLDESDAVYFYNMQAALDFAEKARQAMGEQFEDGASSVEVVNNAAEKAMRERLQSAVRKQIGDIIGGVKRSGGVIVSAEEDAAIQRIADMKSAADERLEAGVADEAERRRLEIVSDEVDKWLDDNVRYSVDGYNPRSSVPKVRGGWTEQKILRYLKQNHALTGIGNATRLIAEFDSPQEFKDHMFYHGTAYGEYALKPSITMSERTVERIGGGGYGQRYWGISLSKSKRVASNFSGMSRFVRIFPVVLSKNASVVERADLRDAADLDDHIVELWEQGADAVWLGDKNSGEQELCVLNPRAIAVITHADSYAVFNLGGEGNPLHIADDAAIETIYNTAKEYRERIKNAPRFKKVIPLPSEFGTTYHEPVKPRQIDHKYFINPSLFNQDMRSYEAEKAKYDAYQSALADYEQKRREFEDTPEYREYEDFVRAADNTIRFSVGAYSPAADKSLRPAARAEMSEIKRKAQADGTFMLAPNGKPTNLTERQWLQVRTRAFKEWFGDWEKVFRIEKLRKSEPIKATGNEYQGKYELNAQSAAKYILDELRGEYINKDSGDKIHISRKGAEKVTHHDAESEIHLKSISLIPQMIENAIYIAEEQNEKSNTVFDTYRYYVVGLNIGGVDYTAKLVVGVKNGEIYYDHALTQIEKGKLLESIDPIKSGFANKELNSNSKDTRLFSILQTNSSQIVDANGEPLTLYHQTNNDFTVFDPYHKGAGQNDYLMPHGIFMKPTDQSIRGMGDKQLALWADIKNPLSFENREELDLYLTRNIAGYGELETEYDRIDKDYSAQINAAVDGDLDLFRQWREELGQGKISEEEYHRRFEEKRKEHDLFFAKWREVQNQNSAKMKILIDNHLRENGNDGIILQNDEGSFGRRTKSIVALSPNQVKSATDNNGSFSEENDDIRFSISNASNEIFVSNAERAVEGIKQEKATAEQWLKMIEKVGGLKAGEDKWIGLSDWLKGQRVSAAAFSEGDTALEITQKMSKPRTVSKQEILDYIRQNKIEIEEVEYGDVTDSGEFKRLEEEFSELCWNIDEVYTQRWVEENNEVEKFYDEMRNKYGDEYLDALSPDEQRTKNYLLDAREVYNKENPNEDDAFQEMVRRYGDDFEMAFWHDGARLFANDNNAAGYYTGGTNQINSTRLAYTTQGLTNKREIALVVPTIESWNESDEVHFGDAGEGRAVAWIRFGDAYIPADGGEKQRQLEAIMADNEQWYKDHPQFAKYGIGDEALHKESDERITRQRLAYEEAKAVPNTVKVLVIDEIQSKRHQEGREKGYREGEMPDVEKQDKELREQLKAIRQRKDEIIPTNIRGISTRVEYSKNLPQELQAELATLREEESRLVIEINNLKSSRTDYLKQIPAAPFEKNWHELAMKRMLRFAAENGYDKVAWTTGDQQAERYNLGNAVERIEISKWLKPEESIDYDREHRTIAIHPNGRRAMLYTFDRNGDVLGQSGGGGMPVVRTLPELVGKELALKLLTTDESELSGNGLRIGGEGMRGFYDDMLPRFMQKYGKKWGSQVGEVTMPGLEDGYQTMHSVDVTDAMRESVLEGQLMFSVGEAFDPSQSSVDVVRLVSDAVRHSRDGAIRFSVDSFHNGISSDEIWDELGKYDSWNDALYREWDENGETLTPDHSYDYYDLAKQKGVPVKRYYDAYELYSALERYYKGELLEASQGARLAMEDHKVPVPGHKQAGEDGEYHHMAFLTDDGERVVKAVPFVYPEDVPAFLSDDTRFSVGDDVEKVNAKFNNSKHTVSDSTRFSISERDREYADAVKNGDTIKIQRMLREEAERKGYNPDSDYQGTTSFNGTAPSRNTYFPTRRERVEAYNSYEFEGSQSLGDYIEAGIDIGNLDFSIHDPRGFYTASDTGKESIINLRNVVNGKRKTITMYRSVPKDIKENSFRNGDWITPSKQYAIENAYVHGWDKGYHIIEQEVSVDDIWWDCNDINEWGYDDGKDYVYKNTKNNRKLFEVTYDDKGNLIPLSQRFRAHSDDIRFSVNTSSSIDPYSPPRPRAGELPSEYIRRYADWQRNRTADVEHARTEYKKAMKDMRSGYNWVMESAADKYQPLRQFNEWLKEQGVNVSAEHDAYNDMFLSMGRAGYQMQQYKQLFLMPMIKSMRDCIKRLQDVALTWQDEGLDYGKDSRRGQRLTAREVLGVYAQAKDIEEAKQLGLPDRGEAGFMASLGVSHSDVISMVESAVPSEQIDELWKSIRNATKFSLQYQLIHGFIDQETYNKYNQRDYYVPERGWRERDIDGHDTQFVRGEHISAGNPYNAALVAAKGRGSLASDPFAYIQSIAESTITSVEKNRTKQKFLHLCIANKQLGEDSGAFIITTKPSSLVSVNPTTGEEKKQLFVEVIDNGKHYYIQLKDEHLANALNRNFDHRVMDSMVGQVAKKATRFMSAMLTQYNPEFAFRNFFRDFLFATVANSAEQGLVFTGKFLNNVRAVQGTLMRYLVQERYSSDSAQFNGKYGKYLREYFENGAQTGWSFLHDIESLNKDIEKQLKEGLGTKIGRGALETLTLMTELSELTVRFAQYVTMRESGKSELEAAAAAKEITVNFDRHGTLSGGITSLFGFFNATVQGTFRALNIFKKHWGKMTLACASFFVAGFMNAMMNPDDPDDEISLSDFTRMNYFNFGNFYLPVPHFFRMFFACGANAYWAMSGRKTVKHAIYDSVDNAMSEIIPASVFQAHNIFDYNDELDEIDLNWRKWRRSAAPTVVAPIADVALNIDFSGAPVYREPFVKTQDDKIKDIAMYKSSTAQPYIDIAYALHEMTGGNPDVQTRGADKAIDINPSKIEHIVEGYVPTFVKIVVNGGSAAYKKAMGEEVRWRDIPFAKGFYRDYDAGADYSREYYRLKNRFDMLESTLKDVKKHDPATYADLLHSDRYITYRRYRKFVSDKYKPKDIRFAPPAQMISILRQGNDEYTQALQNE